MSPSGHHLTYSDAINYACFESGTDLNAWLILVCSVG